MRKSIKIISTTVVIILVVICILTVISFINHRINLSKEDEKFIPIGQKVEVNGNYMNIFTEGEGDIPLVFMSGGGTSSPVLDFKSLYSLLSDKYKIVVVEKFGYGFSDVVDVPRDIDSILNDTRQALSLAGIKGPYILFPHSMSGIEALYWVQSYPEEIKGIVGLDMAVPKAYEEYKINLPMIKLSALASNLGITRSIPSLAESDSIKYGTLTDDEKELYKIIFYRRTLSTTMINEVTEVKNNAKKVSQNDIPKVPLLMLTSNGVGTGWSEEKWISIQNEFNKDFGGEIIYLDCSHYIHNKEYKKIAKASINFIEKVKN